MTAFALESLTAPDTGDFERLMRLAFGDDGAGIQAYRRNLGDGNIRLFKADGHAVACAGVIPMAQYFGGKRVPSAGIAGVAVDPLTRGRGHAHAMMTGILSEVARAGMPLVTLYASAPGVYAKQGFAAAGRFTRYRLDIARLPRMAPPTSLTPFGQRGANALLDRLRAASVRHHNGMTERPPCLWALKLDSRLGGATDRYLIQCKDGPGGYVLINTESPKRLRLVEVAAPNRDAWSQVLALIAGMDSNRDIAEWIGPPVPQIADLLPRHCLDIDHWEEWMTRIADVQGALAARGYARALTTGLSMTVIDPVLPGNAGTYRLDIAGGDATVERLPAGTQGDIELDVAALAPLFTSHQTAGALARYGVIRGERSAIERADLIFAGPPPALDDKF